MNVEFDQQSDREMNRAIQRLTDAAGKTAKEVLVSQSRLFCADLAYNTRPIGKAASLGQDMKRRIAERIDFIYLPVGAAVNMLKDKNEALAVVFQKAIRRRNYAQASALMNKTFADSWTVGEFDGGDLHREQRFKRRVRRRMVVVNKGRITEYKRQEVKQAGFAKGGFATAARQLGGVRGIPGFATRQTAPGHGSVTGDKRALTVTISNSVRYLRKALDQSAEDRAIRHRVRAINSVLKRMATRRFKSASRSLK